MSKFDPYETLQVPRDAPLADIKRAYRRLSRETHPDVAPADRHEEFKRIGVAYMILSNDRRRKIFDETGETEVREEEEAAAIRKIIRETFNKLIVFCLENRKELKTVFILEQMKGMIEDGIATTRKDYDENKNRISQLREVRDRIHRDDGETNIFAGHLTLQIEALEAVISESGKAMRHMSGALEEIAKYRNDVDTSKAATTSILNGATITFPSEPWKWS